MSLMESTTLQALRSPLRSTIIPSEAYVLSLACLPSCYAASASPPSNAIHLLDKSDLRLVRSLPGHDVATSSLRTVDCCVGVTRQFLVSTGKDGVIKAWDERSESVAFEMHTSRKRRAILSCDVSSDGFTVAGGTDLQGDNASILYWDPRNPTAPVRTHSSTHSDDITSLHFFPLSLQTPQHNALLLSASSDGLVSISNAHEVDEDEAVLHIGNWGCSISRAGWIDPRTASSPGIWAASDMETFSTWSQDLDMLQNIDIRQPTISLPPLTWETDYLIDCCSPSSQPHNGSFDVFVGSNEGNIALLHNPALAIPNATAKWTLEKLWMGGHEGVVRCLLNDEATGVLVTGGEDSKVTVWPISTSDVLNGHDEEHDESMDVDSSPHSFPSSARKRGYEYAINRPPGSEYCGKRARR